MSKFARPKTILDANHMRLSQKNPTTGKWASLVWNATTSGKVKVTCWTGNESDKAQVEFDLITFNHMLQMVEKVVAGTEPGFIFTHEDYNYPGGRKTETRELKGRFIMSREDDKIYIAVISPDTRVAIIKFFLALPETYRVVNKDKQPYSQKDLSNLRCAAYFQTVSTILNQQALDTYQHKAPDGGNGGGGARSARPASGGNEFDDIAL